MKYIVSSEKDLAYLKKCIDQMFSQTLQNKISVVELVSSINLIKVDMNWQSDPGIVTLPMSSVPSEISIDMEKNELTYKYSTQNVKERISLTVSTNLKNTREIKFYK